MSYRGRHFSLSPFVVDFGHSPRCVLCAAKKNGKKRVFACARLFYIFISTFLLLVFCWAIVQVTTWNTHLVGLGAEMRLIPIFMTITSSWVRQIRHRRRWWRFYVYDSTRIYCVQYHYHSLSLSFIYSRPTQSHQHSLRFFCFFFHCNHRHANAGSNQFSQHFNSPRPTATQKKWNENENEFISLATTNKLIILYFYFE